MKNFIGNSTLGQFRLKSLVLLDFKNIQKAPPNYTDVRLPKENTSQGN